MNRDPELEAWEILPGTTHQPEDLLKRIMSNRKYPNQNKYLLQPKQAKAIKNALSFECLNTLFWGDDLEIDQYIGAWFYELAKEILAEDNNDLHRALDDVLIDYVPYAKFKAYLEIRQEIGELYYFHLYKEEFDIGYETLLAAVKPAVLRLFFLIKDEFIRQFKNVFFDKDYLTELHKRIDSFKHDVLMPLLMESKANEISIGVMVYNKIKQDQTQLYKITSLDEMFSPEALWFENYSDIDEFVQKENHDHEPKEKNEIIMDIIKTSLYHIELFNDLQKATGDYIEDLSDKSYLKLENRWSPEKHMCK